MNADIKVKWVEALRSGKYRQGIGELRSRDDKYCCLGVLCDIVAPERWEVSATTGGYSIGTSGKLCPVEVAEIAQIDRAVTHILAMQKNDTGESFAAIADWLEQNL